MRGILEAVRPFPVIPSQVTGIRPAIGDIRNGLVLDMDFGRRYNSNTQVANQSQNGNNGTIHGATWTAGRVGQTLSFDGVDDYVDCGTGTSLNVTTGDVTIEAWVKTSSATNQPIFSHSQNITGYPGYYCRVRNTNVLALYVSDGTNAELIAGTNTGIIDGNWHHVAVFWDGSEDEATFYIDGVPETVSASVGYGSLTATASGEIGRSEVAGTYFNGTIDEVRIYNRALSAEEIRQRYVYSNMQAGILI